MAEAAVKKAPAKKPAAAKKAPAQSGTTITVRQVRSGAGQNAAQRSTLTGLGFRKNQQTREIADTAENRGMIRKIQHLLEVVEK